MSNEFNRREMLKWMSAGAGAAAVGGGIFLAGRTSAGTGSAATANAARRAGTGGRQADGPPVTDGAAPPQPAPLDAGAAQPAADGVRTLVVLELNGGNDGLSMFVPYGMGAYYDLRQRTSIAADQVHAIDGELGLHPALSTLATRRLAVVEGVGSSMPDGSHFTMSRRWWEGDIDGLHGFGTGVWGRIADALDDGSTPAVALSLGPGMHPALVSASAPTLSLPGGDAAYYLVGAAEDDVSRFAFQRSVSAFGNGSTDGAYAAFRRANGLAIGFGNQLLGLGDGDADDDGQPDSGISYPGSNLGTNLSYAARLIAAQQGVRVIHVTTDGFDTHENHLDQYNQLMTDLDAALGAFLSEMDALGFGDRVLVALTSEFGRRIQDNGSNGLDHGTASSLALIGPMNTGRYGQHPSLDEFDDDHNLIATVGFDQYYATIAQGWFGLDPAVVAEGVDTIGGIF